MSKPDDISEELHLRAAETVVLFPHPFKSVAATGKAISLVARAIMAAEQRGEERERATYAEPTTAFTVRPMATAPSGDGALEPSEIDVHEGSWAILVGTNAKPIGWIDTHETFNGRTYRDRMLPAPPLANDIPQDVWNAVISILGHPGVLVSAGCYERIATQSARALMSAEKQGQEHERAACALSAAAFAAKHEDTGAGDDFDMGYRHAARVIADAISKRGA